ncbi:type IV secretory system conjugative DNA transfer family protein [Listeria booriae]|uniref:Type IV secretory system conjugative DNA transfer family protein n=1 Tax=Listeria booriae TaxID=1552123 RepID=A0A7X0XUJ6_9LIST|nr:type IV secretory system conjugative DNA transfer family protein [Listeria booriae]MBC1780532.1 type IV secretory system conjugative DNA transfer family protein [Listeria booriae]
MVKTAGKVRSFLGSYFVVLPFCCIVFLGITMVANFMLQLYLQVKDNALLDFSSGRAIVISTDYFFAFQPVGHGKYYLCVFGMASILALFIGYKLRSNLGSLMKGLKSNARFATWRELKKQYVSIPEKGDPYDGVGGIPIGRFLKPAKKTIRFFGRQIVVLTLTWRLLIDNSNTHTLLLGMTRSGKFVYFFSYVFENLSRALLLKNRPSFVTSDLKGELIIATKKMLEKRGYIVYAMNFVDQTLSMFYNPLQKVIDAYLIGDIDEAEVECQSIAYTLYHDPKESQKYFQNSAIHLFTALVLAVCDKAINVKKNCTAANGSVEPISDLDKEIKVHGEAGEIVMVRFPSDRIEKLIFLQSETQTLTIPEALTWEDTLTFTFIRAETGEKRAEYIVPVIKTDVESITLFSVAMMLRELGTKNVMVENEEGTKVPKNALTWYFDQFDSMHPARGQFAQTNFGSGDSTSDVMSTTMEKLTQFTNTKNAKMTAKNSLNLEDLGFGEKPVAVFMILPEGDDSNNGLASIFIKQAYQSLVKRASKEKGQKLLRRVFMNLDEFGNLLKIDGLKTMLTMGLGKGIIFNLGVQEYSQLIEVYGNNDADTIKSTCGNHVYLKSGLPSTNKEVSENLGSYEYEGRSRSGHTFSVDKHKNESLDERPLLKPEELSKLRRGEMVLLRNMKREDNKDRDITAHPIFVKGHHRLSPSYKGLKEYMDPSSQSIQDIGLVSQVKDVDLDHITPRDFIPYAEAMFEHRPYLPQLMQQKRIKTWKDLSVQEFFSTDQLQHLKTLCTNKVDRLDEDDVSLIERSTNMFEFNQTWKMLKQQNKLNDITYQTVKGWMDRRIEQRKKVS